MNLDILQRFLSGHEYEAQMARRAEFIARTTNDPLQRADEWRQMKDDIFRFIDNCVWIQEPRNVGDSEIAYMPFPYQVELITKLDTAFHEGKDLFVEKSRDMGVTWTLAVFAIHKFIFYQNASFLFGSRKEDGVDDLTINSIFGKMRFILTHTPAWLKPHGWKKKLHDNRMKLVNPETGSIIQGESSNENFSRSGRYNMIFMDEIWFWPHYREAIRATQDAASSRVYVSTPVEDSFAKRFIANLRELGMVMTIHWKESPLKDDVWYKGELLKRGSDQSAILAELELNYDVSPEIRYYPEAYECKARSIGFDPNYPLYTGCDFGAFVDYSAIIWFQYVESELRVLEAIMSHGRLMQGKILLDWWVPYLKFDKEYDANWYNEYELGILEGIRKWHNPVMNFGEAAHKQAMMPIGISIQAYLASAGVTLLMNDNAVKHPERKAAVQRYLPNTVFNSDSDGAMLAWDSLKSAKRPDVSLRPNTNDQSGTKPLHLSGESDLRAAFENGCSCLPKFSGEGSQAMVAQSYAKRRR